jgi:hypothetical protein
MNNRTTVMPASGCAGIGWPVKKHQLMTRAA